MEKILVDELRIDITEVSIEEEPFEVDEDDVEEEPQPEYHPPKAKHITGGIECDNCINRYNSSLDCCPNCKSSNYIKFNSWDKRLFNTIERNENEIFDDEE